MDDNQVLAILARSVKFISCGKLKRASELISQTSRTVSTDQPELVSHCKNLGLIAQTRKYLGKADSLLNTGDYCSALNKYLSIGSREVPRELKFHLLHNKAVCYARTGQMKEALCCFQEALARNTSHSKCLQNTAFTLMALCEYELALRHFSEVIRIDKVEPTSLLHVLYCAAICRQHLYPDGDQHAEAVQAQMHAERALMLLRAREQRSPRPASVPSGRFQEMPHCSAPVQPNHAPLQIDTGERLDKKADAVLRAETHIPFRRLLYDPPAKQSKPAPEPEPQTAMEASVSPNRDAERRKQPLSVPANVHGQPTELFFASDVVGSPVAVSSRSKREILHRAVLGFDRAAAPGLATLNEAVVAAAAPAQLRRSRQPDPSPAVLRGQHVHEDLSAGAVSSSMPCLRRGRGTVLDDDHCDVISVGRSAAESVLETPAAATLFVVPTAAQENLEMAPSDHSTLNPEVVHTLQPSRAIDNPFPSAPAKPLRAVRLAQEFHPHASIPPTLLGVTVQLAMEAPRPQRDAENASVQSVKLSTATKGHTRHENGAAPAMEWASVGSGGIVASTNSSSSTIAVPRAVTNTAHDQSTFSFSSTRPIVQSEELVAIAAPRHTSTNIDVDAVMEERSISCVSAAMEPSLTVCEAPSPALVHNLHTPLSLQPQHAATYTARVHVDQFASSANSSITEDSSSSEPPIRRRVPPLRRSGAYIPAAQHEPSWQQLEVERALESRRHVDQYTFTNADVDRLLAQDSSSSAPPAQEPENFYPYHALRAPGPFPAGVDVRHREYYLSPDEFARLLRVDKSTWADLPAWRRRTIKQALGLF